MRRDWRCLGCRIGEGLYLGFPGFRDFLFLDIFWHLFVSQLCAFCFLIVCEMANFLMYWSIVSLVTGVLSIPTISISGTKFFLDNADKTQFFIKGTKRLCSNYCLKPILTSTGVAYQPGGSSKLSDPLADKAQCEADVSIRASLRL